MLLTCNTCKNVFEKENKEYNRRIRAGATKFFCSIKCGRLSYNTVKMTEKICKCGTLFTTTLNKNGRSFCSSYCAHKYSYYPSEARVLAGKISGPKTYKKNFITAQECLYKRETWKYVDIKIYLDRTGIKYAFEFMLDRYSFDLALINKMVLIEFDGPDHRRPHQKYIDQIKDKTAADLGWQVKRIECKPNTVINTSLLQEIL